MKKKNPVKIFLESPCNNVWDEMEPRQHGRHCNSCQKTVIDFTGMTDGQVFNYLEANPGCCGRFYREQLGRDIIPSVPKKNSWSNIPKIAASLLAFLSLKTMHAETGKKKAGTIQHPSEKKYTDQSLLPDTLLLSGIVKDPDGKALAAAEVSYQFGLALDL